ncbi:phthiocerol/phthiodiolone dimycocerosyl transferase family protein [Tsukamurella ocularis]|uniref:phthiocerol/phthiodiolone dimycocerosyl transferase family protein n=1 Tax=Tsukamurella ocularis TaxID=1970234 RepID=UPI00216869C6|nr:hypothetical protein [Tsukamurella ocularis]MCS3781638.1 hypothetical protein [Tsukamurella ocularis]MCS3788132.1 hypothetical protein [Tsukamurella ocularis]MCS3851852.1 hypothetical protein [Tsukamurella ocularis]
MTTTLRPLASSEIGFVGPHPTTCAFELTVRGPLDSDALTDALAALRAEYPALDAAVAPAGDGYAFVAPAGGATRTDGPEAPLVDPATALARLHVTSFDDRHRVALAVNHALADGTHLYALLRRLWSHYTALVRTGATDIGAPQPFPGSAQRVLADLDVPKVSTGRARLDGARWYGSAPVLGPRGDDAVLPETISLRFSPETTAGLLAAAEGIGLNALISGILLTAERAGFLGEDPAAPIRVGAMTLVDLRRRVRPLLDATEVTNFVGASYAAPELTSASDPAAVGDALARTVRRDVRGGRALTALAIAAASSEAPEPPVVLSNLGPLDVDLPDGLVAEDLRPILSMDSAALHVPDGARRPSPSATIHQVSTFRGRLGIEAITLGGTASADARAAVADRIDALVHAAARRAPAA